MENILGIIRSELIPDIERMLEIQRRISEGKAVFLDACKMRKGKMKNEQLAESISKQENELLNELIFLKRKWGLLGYQR